MSEDPGNFQHVTDYCVITQCSINYKIFAKILTNRLQSVVTGIIRGHQTCGIRGDTFQTNALVSRGVLDCYVAVHSRVAMLQTDFVKAIDHIRHDVLSTVLYVVSGTLSSREIRRRIPTAQLG